MQQAGLDDDDMIDLSGDSPPRPVSPILDSSTTTLAGSTATGAEHATLTDAVQPASSMIARSVQCALWMRESLFLSLVVSFVAPHVS